MSLQFILGNSGSGKSDNLYKKTIEEAGLHPEKNYLILVPEQFTMATQRKLTELAPNHAIMNIDVLSFKRLAYRIFDELGIKDLNVLEETGKNLILRRIAGEKKEELTVLKRNISRMGYISELKSLISELLQYDISPDQLEAYSMRPDLSDTFSAKLKDIIIMYRSFQDYLKGSYVTAEEILHILIREAPRSQILRGSVMIFDEYTGFTPIQNKLMRELLVLAEKVQIILTMDCEEPYGKVYSEHELFYLPGKTIKSLSDLAREEKIDILDPIILGREGCPRFQDSKDLAYLEQNLFRDQLKSERPVSDSRDVILSTLTCPREELQLACREIVKLVREEGYRYRDIAIVTGDVSAYENYVDEICRKYTIPYFMDQTRKMVFHPFIESIRALLQIADDDFSYESVIRFLRSGFSDIEEEQIDILENYLLVTGIRGHKNWSSFWAKNLEKNGFDLQLVNQLRVKVFSLIDPLYQAFRNKETVSREILALYRILTTLNSEKKLWKREQEYLADGQQSKSKEYAQIYRIVMELLEKFNRLLGAEHLDAAQFSEILDAGLSEAQVAVIPPGYDSVTIGDIERTRLTGIKVLFFVGVNDGIIPKASGNGGIISEFERELLQEADFELAPGPREQAFIQHFYLYTNLTKPSDRLYISYSRVDSNGKALRPSYLIALVSRLFQGIPVHEYGRLSEEMDLSTRASAMDFLVNGDKNDAWHSVARYFVDTEETREETLRLLQAQFHTLDNDPISRVIANALYGRELSGSVSRLEQYASCAYSHFLKYGLKLRERKNNEFENVDIGNIYHDALYRYSINLQKTEYDWFKVPDEVREDLSRQSIAEAIQGYPDAALYTSEENSHQMKRMESIFVQTVWALTEQVRHGRFVPSEFEISFQEIDNENNLKVVFDNEHTMQMYGRIDRMDLCNDGSDCYIKIIDYKSGSQSFDLLKVYKGLSLQLVAYLNVALDYAGKKHPGKTIHPGALFYYNIDDPVADLKMDDAVSEDQVMEMILEQLRPDGLVSSDENAYLSMDENLAGKSKVIPVTLKKDGSIYESQSRTASEQQFSIIQEYVTNKIAETGRLIYEGNIDVNPYDSGNRNSCTFCPYSSICGINSRLPGAHTRTLDKISKEDLISKMETYNAIVSAQSDDLEQIL